MAMGTMMLTKNDDDEDDDGDDDDAGENDDGSQQRPQVIWRISASRAGHRRGRGEDKRGKAIKRREERGRRPDGDDGTSSSGNSLGVPCVSCLPPSLCGAQRSSTLSFLNMI